MVSAFRFSGIPEIIFGPGSLDKLPAILSRFGNRYLLITGASSFASGRKGKKFLEKMEKESGALYRGRVIKEPSPADIDEIVNEYRGKKCDAVISIGGGSAIDSGKAVAAMLTLDSPVAEYLEGVGSRRHPGTTLPFIAVPTTAGTGSEATKNAVLSEVGPAGFKKSLRHDHFIPDIALIDPELTLNCPPEITAASGMDALTQLLESYVSVSSNEMTDSLAVRAIELIFSNLEYALFNGEDLKARCAMSYAALISGITLANAGLGIVHGFASSVGCRIDIPHGILCGNLVGIANRMNVEKMLASDPENSALIKYSRLGRMVSRSMFNTVAENALALADKIDELTDKLNINRLGQYGLDEAQAAKIVQETGQKNNPVPMTDNELLNMIRSRL